MAKKGICAVAMSGGVDSAVAAVLLREQGYDIHGVYLRMKPDSLADDDIADARNISSALGTKLEVLDVREDFKRLVTDRFINEYLHGLTPSPCIFCNPQLKFAKLLEYSHAIGAQYIATGHYARIGWDENNNTPLLLKGLSKKDQSYFLSGLNREILSHTVFPLGELDKDSVRAIAREKGIPVSEKRDSTEVCFIPDNDYVKFIEASGEVLPPSGAFLDAEKNRIGTHTGIYKYTVGQRKGLGAFGEPKFVICVNAADNTVTLGENKELFKSRIYTDKISWISEKAPEGENGIISAQVKIRSAAPCAPAEIKLTDNGAEIIFSTPQRAPAPGQAAVIYDGDIVLGKGIISNFEF